MWQVEKNRVSSKEDYYFLQGRDENDANVSKENEESKVNIENNSKEIDQANIKVSEIQESVDKVQEAIDNLRSEKVKEVDAQKTAQTSLNKLNKDLQKVQKKLNELNKNKERELKIVSLKEDITDTEKEVESISNEIETNTKELETENEKKKEKQEEIDKYITEKDESWKKQKGYQKALNELKSDLSMEKSKLNNFSSKKLMTTDQIETLYQRSKDYGAIPPVTDELSEAGLQSDIATATLGHDRIWFVVFRRAIEEYREEGYPDHPQRAWLEQHYNLVSVTSFNDLDIYEYQSGLSPTRDLGLEGS